MKLNKFAAIGLLLILALVAVILLRKNYGHSVTSGHSVTFVSPGLGNPFFVDMADAAKDEAAKNSSLSFTVQSPTTFANLQQQVDIIETAIAQRVEAICLVAVDSKGIVPVLKKAQDAGVRIVLIDNAVDAELAAAAGLRMPTRVGSDNALGGKLAGQFLVTTVGGAGDVAILEGIPSEVANARKGGFLEAVRTSPGVKVVASQRANYSRAEALDVTRALLLAHPHLRGIFAANDEMALGALKAIEETRRTAPLAVVGFDAIDEAIKSIQAGALAGTVQQQPKEMGRQAVRAAVALLGGQAVAMNVMVPVTLVNRLTLPPGH